MRVHARKISFAMCVAMLCLFVLLFLLGYATNPWDHNLSLSQAFHVGVWSKGLDSRIVVFNDSDYGPYRGSIVGLAGGEHPHTNAFDVVGVYYRHFAWSESVLWTLMVSVWYPILFLSIWPVWRLVHRIRYDV